MILFTENQILVICLYIRWGMLTRLNSIFAILKNRKKNH